MTSLLPRHIEDYLIATINLAPPTPGQDLLDRVTADRLAHSGTAPTNPDSRWRFHLAGVVDAGVEQGDDLATIIYWVVNEYSLQTGSLT